MRSLSVLVNRSLALKDVLLSVIFHSPLFLCVSLQALAEKRKRSQKTEAHRDNLKLLLDYLTHLKLTHAIDRNLHLIHTMKNPKPGAKIAKPEEFVRVYDILLQVYNV